MKSNFRFKGVEVGMRFGKLLVVSECFGERINGSRSWLCKCDCGVEKKIGTVALTTGNSVTCGNRSIHSNRIRHGHASRKNGRETKEYTAWMNLTSRCRKSKHYIKRGITVAEEFLVFENFLSDIGLCPDPSFQIDRIDDKRGYEPGNVKWVTKSQQMQNRSTYNRILTIDGEAKCITEWGRINGIDRRTISHRLDAGWDVKSAVFCQTRQRRHK